MARRIAGDPTSTWPRLDTDPFGRLLDYGRTVYRPPQDLTDFVIALSSRSHHAKHEAGWTVRGDPAEDLTWTSPTGHEYRSPPGHLPIDQTSALEQHDELDPADVTDLTRHPSDQARREWGHTSVGLSRLVVPLARSRSSATGGGLGAAGKDCRHED
jgi:hypothetical protein